MKFAKWIISLVVIGGLAYLSQVLTKINPAIEFPIYAVILGLVIGNIPFLKVLGIGAKPELYIKIGLVLLGASVNFAVIMSVGARGLLQAIIGMPLVFFFTWYICKWFKIDDKVKALLSTAVSICGVSAAVAAAGSVVAKKEQLTYVIALVILFALPLMILMPVMAHWMNLSPAVAGAWMGNNIDTTAAVTGAAQIYGEQALKVASIVKMSQNLFIGLAAFLLALWFATKFRRTTKPKAIDIWQKFPKFVIGFIFFSVIAPFSATKSTTLFSNTGARRPARACGFLR